MARFRGDSGVVALAFVVLAGCDGQAASRQLAVTLLDAPRIACVGITNTPALEQETMDSIAKDLERQWRDQREQDPPAAEGRVLRVNETERAMQAWFDPHPGSDFFSDAEAYDSPFVVYAGDVQEGYLEGQFVEVFNTDKQDEDAGRELCGDRARMQGILSVTDDDGILGRIRWTHHVWVDSVTSACGGRIDCVRDIGVDGLELE